MAKTFLKTVGTDNPVLQYPIDKARYRADDGRPLEIVNTIKPLSPAALSRLKKTFDRRAGSWLPMDRSGVWRYREFLPAFKPYYVLISMPEGNTPVAEMAGTAEYCGLYKLQAKLGGFSPTGSFYDNGMAAAVTMARILGITRVACVSTGSAAASMAAYAARAGIKCIAFIPENGISEAKLSQVLDYGALTIQIAGGFEDARRVAEEACRIAGVYCVDPLDPFMIEGQKTILIEMLHQLDWIAPDWMVVTAGMARSAHNALNELKTTGLIDRLPKLAVIGVTVDPHGNGGFDPEENRAGSIPGVAMEQVTEDDIAVPKHIIGKDGIGADPASAATVAGCKILVRKGIIRPEESVVCLFTGHVLKAPEYAIDFHRDRLYLDSVRPERIPGKRRVTTLRTFNELIKVEADVKKVLEIIQPV